MISFFVHGIPKPGGSKRFVGLSKKGRAILVDASGKAGSDWRGDVKAAASAAYQGEPLDEPLFVDVLFTMPRPKSHYRTGKRAGELRNDPPVYHATRPDATKLWRQVEDSLTGICWRDDSCIAVQKVQKIYGLVPGVRVSITTLSGSE